MRIVFYSSLLTVLSFLKRVRPQCDNGRSCGSTRQVGAAQHCECGAKKVMHCSRLLFYEVRGLLLRLIDYFLILQSATDRLLLRFSKVIIDCTRYIALVAFDTKKGTSRDLTFICSLLFYFVDIRIADKQLNAIHIVCRGPTIGSTE